MSLPLLERKAENILGPRVVLEVRFLLKQGKQKQKKKSKKKNKQKKSSQSKGINKNESPAFIKNKIFPAKNTESLSH